MFRIGPQPVTQLGCGNMFVCSKTLLWAFESACSAQESFRGVQMTSLTKSRQFPVCFCVMSLNPRFYLLSGVARPCQSPESDRDQLWTLELQAERVPVLWV